MKLLTLTFYKINPFFGLVSLKRVERIEPYDFASFSSLPSKITVLELNKLHLDSDLQFESNDFKSFLINNKQTGTDKLASIALKIKSGFDCLLSKRDIQNFKSAFKIDATTTENDIKNICLNFAAHFKIHGKRISLLCDKVISSLFDDYKITVATASEIAESYHQFHSCMTKFSEKMPLFYSVPYNDSGKTSIGVLIFWERGIMRGRAVYRVKGKKVAAFYGSERIIFNALCKRNGYKAPDCSALIGARMPIVLDANGALLVPFIDCQDKSISLRLDDEGDYLVIGTKLDNLSLLGTGDSQKLELNNRTSYYDDYFSDDYETNTICSNCECDVDDDDYSTDCDGNILCQECSGYCENCEQTVLFDDIVTALSETRNGNYERICVCSCCADSTDHMAVF